MSSVPAHHRPTISAALDRDPVCGMDVDPGADGPRSEHQGVAYHFCSAHCQAKFEADPTAYTGELEHGQHAEAVTTAVSTAVPTSDDVEYTCPMHPEVRQHGPGACPICGMALEPVVVTAETGPSAELADMTRRFWIALVLSVPVFLLEMGGHLFPALHEVVSPTASAWAQLVLATPVVLWAGWPFFTRGWVSVRTLKLNMFTLIAMGTGVA